MSSTNSENGESQASTSKQSKVHFIVKYFDPDIRAVDPEGRDLDRILSYSDNQISRYHDFIQYLFPLPEESMVNPYAPLITRQVYDAFRDREELRSELLQGLLRMLEYYGFTFSAPESGDSEKQIVPGSSFKEQSKYSWRCAMDHNHLRITRIIRCLRVLSCEKEAQAFYHALLQHDTGNVVRKSSRTFWWRAAERPLWLPPDEPDEDALGIRWLKKVCEEQEANAAAEEVSKAEEDQTMNDGTEVAGKEDEAKGAVESADDADMEDKAAMPKESEGNAEPIESKKRKLDENEPKEGKADEVKADNDNADEYREDTKGQ